MTAWFTADQHFGHGRLLELSAARGAAFPSISEMNARLVHNWNSGVQPDDTVWALGDVDMHGKDATLALTTSWSAPKSSSPAITTPAGPCPASTTGIRGRGEVS